MNDKKSKYQKCKLNSVNKPVMYQTKKKKLQ